MFIYLTEAETRKPTAININQIQYFQESAISSGTFIQFPNEVFITVEEPLGSVIAKIRGSKIEND